MCSRVSVVGDEHQSITRIKGHSTALFEWIIWIDSALSLKLQSKVSYLCRDGICTAISTLWYSTELMAISKNKDKQQIQKVPLWTKPGILSGAYYLLFEKKKKSLGEFVNCQRADRPGQNRASEPSGSMSSELVWGGKRLVLQAVRAGLDAGDGRILPFQLQFKSYHDTSSRQNHRPLTNYSILRIPMGLWQQETGHLCSTFLYPTCHPLPQKLYNKDSIKNTSEAVQ